MKQIILLLLLTASGAALAESNASDELSQLKAELNEVRLEQQSIYQNYQMTSELRRIEVQEGLPPMRQYPYGTSIDTPPPNYEDVVRLQLKREKLIQEHTSELNRLSVRYLELEDQRKAILQQIRDLEQPDSPLRPE